jgi:hypothetical protein
MDADMPSASSNEFFLLSIDGRDDRYANELNGQRVSEEHRYPNGSRGLTLFQMENKGI